MAVAPLEFARAALQNPAYRPAGTSLFGLVESSFDFDDCRSERWQVTLHDFENHPMDDVVVVVAQHIADGDDLLPGYLGALR